MQQYVISWRREVPPHPALTARQNEIALLLVEGHKPSEIAWRLSLKPESVREMVRRICVRLDIPASTSSKPAAITRRMCEQWLEEAV